MYTNTKITDDVHSQQGLFLSSSLWSYFTTFIFKLYYEVYKKLVSFFKYNWMIHFVLKRERLAAYMSSRNSYRDRDIDMDIDIDVDTDI